MITDFVRRRMKSIGKTKREVQLEAKEYLESIEKIPVLTKEEESELFESLASADGDIVRKTIINRIVSGSLHLVVRVARCFINTQVDFLDLVQEGNLRLLALVEKFDKNFNTRFSTYAVPGLYLAMFKLDRVSRRNPSSQSATVELLRSLRDPRPDYLAIAHEMVSLNWARVAYVASLLDRLPESLVNSKHRNIFKRFYRLEGKPRESLNQLAVEYKVTRNATSLACKRIWGLLARYDPKLNSPSFEAELDNISKFEFLLSEHSQ